LKPETKFYAEIKKHFKEFSLIRLENLSLAGTPVKSLASRDVKLYEGKDIVELAACGLSLDACCSGLEACRLKLAALGA
jgi:hypothetical protein